MEEALIKRIMPHSLEAEQSVICLLYTSGRVLLDNCRECEEAGGRVLILMCAEADTNSRIHAYMNNNLWGIRGLHALSELLSWSGRAEEAGVFEEMADALQKNVEAVLRCV